MTIDHQQIISEHIVLFKSIDSNKSIFIRIHLFQGLHIVEFLTAFLLQFCEPGSQDFLVEVERLYPMNSLHLFFSLFSNPFVLFVVVYEPAFFGVHRIIDKSILVHSNLLLSEQSTENINTL